MLINNTEAVPFFKSQVPQAYLSGFARLAGVGAAYMEASAWNAAGSFVPEFTSAPRAMRFAGMRGLGDDISMGFGDQPGTTPAPAAPAGTGVPPASDLATQLNAETFYLTNLYRGVTGQPPLPASAAPTVQVGLSQSTINMLAIGGIGIAGLVMFTRRRKRA